MRHVTKLLFSLRRESKVVKTSWGYRNDANSKQTMAKKKQRKDDSDDESEASNAMDFESALAEVEEIVRKLESGEADLTDSLGLYEAGIKRLKQCHDLLNEAEQRVTMLSGFDADGNAVTTEFEADVTESLKEKQAARSRRRGGGKPNPRKSSSKGASGDSRVEDPPGLF